jgi:ATP cone domain
MSTKVKKASGMLVPFSASKLRQSLQRSGASPEITENVISEIQSQLYEGMSTKQIYQHAFKLLKKFSKPQAAKYKLKNAIMELGPTGFPFEKYFAEILRYQGYSVKVGEIVKGHCVNHEIDVIAEKGNMKFMIECKFHNATGINCDVKVPLYIHSRFKDVEKKWIEYRAMDQCFIRDGLSPILNLLPMQFNTVCARSFIWSDGISPTMRAYVIK